MTRAEFRARIEPHPGAARVSDRARQVAVIAAVAYALVAGALVATSPLGVAGVQSGAFAADGSFLGVGTTALAVWVVLFAGLAAYAIWQALPRQAAAARPRALGWWIGAAAALDGLWATAARHGPLWSTVVVAFLLLAVLLIAYVRAVRTAQPQSAWWELLLVDGVIGLHLGWVLLAAFGNLAALLTTGNPAFWSDRAPLWGGILVVFVAVAGLVVSASSHWRVTPPLAIAWGLLWIAVGRLNGEPYSEGVGLAAAIAAVILAIAPVLTRVTLALRPSVD